MKDYWSIMITILSVLVLLMLAALLLSGCAGTISPVWQQRVVIKNDRGGYIHRFQLKYARWARQNKEVAVDGYCASSCTMAIGMIKRSNLCVTPRAVWGFHGSYVQTITGKQENPGDTHLMTEQYTDDINAWIESKGGLHTYKTMLLLKWPETQTYFRVCR